MIGKMVEWTRCFAFYQWLMHTCSVEMELSVSDSDSLSHQNVTYWNQTLAARKWSPLLPFVTQFVFSSGLKTTFKLSSVNNYTLTQHLTPAAQH